MLPYTSSAPSPLHIEAAYLSETFTATCKTAQCHVLNTHRREDPKLYPNLKCLSEVHKPGTRSSEATKFYTGAPNIVGP
jgi:hypothetical protein